MTTKEQDANEQQYGPGGAPASGKRGVSAGKRQTGASQPRPTLGDSQAVCRLMVDSLFGERHWASKWVMALCEADSQFAIHLAEQPRGYAHFMCLIRLALLEQRGSGRSPRADARLLRTTSKKSLLKKLFPSHPAGILNTLPKLPNKPLKEHEYRWLIHALADKRIRKHLLHIKRIKKLDVFLANDALNFPAQFRAAAMRCIKDEDDYEAFWRTVQAAKNFGLNVAEREVIQAADHPAGAHELKEWFMNKISRLPFPPPPWEGDDEIRPIRSRDELKDAGEKFNNCLTDSHGRRHYASRVVAGFVYFYVCDRMPALIEVEREIFWGWRIDEMEGIKRGTPRPHQRRELNQRFLKAGISPGKMRRPPF